MEPIVDGLEETYGNEFEIVRVNIDTSNGKKVAREHGIIGKPSYIFFDQEGEETRRMAGPQFAEVMAQEIERILRG